jgi:hypothetical protein
MKQPDFETRQAAWRYFGLHRWSMIQLAALQLAMAECNCLKHHRDVMRIQRIKNRWPGISRALEYYADNSDLYWS